MYSKEPWKATPCGSHEGNIDIRAGSGTIMCIETVSGDKTEDEDNIKLTLSAPDLLETCKEARATLVLCQLLDKSGQATKSIDVIEAAIAKAV